MSDTKPDETRQGTDPSFSLQSDRYAANPASDADDVPLWALIYLITIVAFAAWAVFDDLRKGDSRLRVAADVSAMVSLCVLFAGHFRQDLVAPLGRFAAPLFLVSFLWTGVAAQREIAEEADDPDLSPKANFVAEHIGIAIGVTMFSPLIAFAGLTAVELW